MENKDSANHLQTLTPKSRYRSFIHSRKWDRRGIYT